MTQPVLLKQSFLIAAMTAVQSLVPWATAMATLYALMRLSGLPFSPSSMDIMVVGVLCLLLIEPPKDVPLQLASASLPAATGVIARWLLVLIALALVNYFASILRGFPW